MEYEASLLNIKVGLNTNELLERYLEKLENTKNWFASNDLKQSEIKTLLSLTNEIISKITRYAYHIMETLSSGANRKEEYKKLLLFF